VQLEPLKPIKTRARTRYQPFNPNGSLPRMPSSNFLQQPSSPSLSTLNNVLMHPLLLRAADRYAYTGCGSTAYCYLFYLRDEQILIHIEKSCRSSACLVRITGPCSAGSLSSWSIPAVVYEPANHHRDAQHLCPHPTLLPQN
jgi:hypothetical protein